MEALFVVECIAPAEYHIDRFLPPTPVRVLVDHRGNAVAVDSLPPSPPAQTGQAQTAGGRALASRTDMRDRILPRMIESTKQLADTEVGAIVTRARKSMRVQLDAEIMRLRQLQKVNRSVRDAEIEALVTQRGDLDTYIAAARVRLDGVRLIHRGPGR